MKDCITVYLDANGSKHPAYYNVFKTSGHKLALKSYLEAMRPILNADLQKSAILTDADIRKLDAEVKASKGTLGGPSRSKAMVSEFNADEISLESVLYHHAMKTIKGDALRKAQFEAKTKSDQYTEVEAEKEGIRINMSNDIEYAELMEKEAKDLRERWKNQTENKLDMHNMLDEFVQAKQVAYTRDGKVEPTFLSIFANQRGDVGHINYKVLERLDRLTNDIWRKYPTANLYSELNIDGKTKGKYWGNKSKIDLLVHVPIESKGEDQSLTFIYDYKFYEERAYEGYDSDKWGYLAKPANGLINNPRDLNAIQMSEYHYMAETLGFKNIQTLIIPFQLKLDEEASVSDAVVYEDIENKPLRPTNYIKAQTIALLKKKGANISEKSWTEKVNGKISSFKALMEDVLSSSIIYSGDLENDDTYTHSSKYNAIKVRVTTDKRTGKKTFRNKMLKKIVEVKGATRKQQQDFIDKYTKELKNYIVSTEDTAINLVQSGFDDAALKTVNNKTATIIRGLFEGTTPQSHTYSRLSNNPKYADANIVGIISRDKITGATGLHVLSEAAVNSMQFDTGDGKKRDHILGTYLTNNGARRYQIKAATALRSGDIQVQDTEMNMEMLKVGIIYKEMKAEDPTLLLVPAKVASRSSSDIQPISMPLDKLNHIVSTLGRVVPKDRIDSNYSTMLTDTDITQNNLTADHYLLRLEEILEEYDTSSSQSQEEVVKTLKDELLLKGLSKGENFRKINKSLNKLLIEMEFDARRKGIKEEALIQNPTYMAVNSLKIAMAGMDPLLMMGDESIGISFLGKTFGDILSTMSAVNHPYFSTLNEINKGANVNILRDYEDRRTESAKLVRALMKSKGITANLSVPSEKARLFAGLYEDYDSTNPNEVKDNLLVLKDPAKAGSKEEADLIRFLIKQKDDMMKLRLTETEYNSLKDDSEYNPRAMQVREKSAASEAAEGMPLKKRLMGIITSTAGHTFKEHQSGSSAYNEIINNPFINQVRNSEARLEAAGYNAYGERLKKAKPIKLETNAEVLFENMVLTTITQEYYEEAIRIKKSVITALAWQQMSEYATTKMAREEINQFTDLTLFGGIKDKGAQHSNSPIVKASNVMSKVVLALSASYMATEITVNTLNIMAEGFAQSLMKRWSPGSNIQFTTRDLIRAVLMYVKNRELSNAIAHRYNMNVRVPNKMKTQAFRESQSIYFSSGFSYWMNAMPIEVSQTTVFLAKLIHDGSLEAHSLDKNGQLQYDETLDKRFYVQPGEQVSAQEKKQRKILLDFYKNELAKEGGVNEDGTLKRAYTNIDTLTIYAITTERLASLSSDQKVLVERSALGIAGMRFKGWMVAKKEAWWREYDLNSKLKHSLKWHQDSTHENGGFYYYEGDVSEGMFNTLMALPDLFKAHGPVPEGLKVTRRDNYFKVLVNFLLMVTGFGLNSFLDDKEERWVRQKDGTMKLKLVAPGARRMMLYKAFNNALEDLVFIPTLYNTLLGDNNLLPVAATITRTVAATFAAASGAIDQDLDKVLYNTNKIMRTSGAVRSVEDLSNWDTSSAAALFPDTE